MSARVRPMKLGPAFVSALALFVALMLHGCGGGGGGDSDPDGGSPGGGGGTGGSTVPANPPAPPTVTWGGNSDDAAIDAEAASTLPGIVLGLPDPVFDIAALVDPEFFETPGEIDGELLTGADGGSATLTGRVNDNSTGWLEFDFDGFAEDGVTLDGAVVVEMTDYPPSGYAGRIALREFAIASDDESVVTTGSADVEVSVNSPASTRVSADMIVSLDTASGQDSLRLGPAFVMQRDPWPGLEADVLEEYVSSAPAVTMQGALYHDTFGRFEVSTDADAPPLYISVPEFPGNLEWPFTNGVTLSSPVGEFARLRVGGLNRYFGVIELSRDASGPFDTTYPSEYDQELDPDPLLAEATQAIPHAGGDRRAAVGDEHVLDGRWAGLGGDGFVTQHWRIVHQPPGSDIELVDAQSPMPVLTPVVPGDYILEQTVVAGDHTARSTARVRAVDTDEDLASERRFDAGPDQVAALGEYVHLDGRRSPTPDGRPLEDLNWRADPILGGASSLSDTDPARAQFMGSVPGYHRIRLDAETQPTAWSETFDWARVYMDSSSNLYPAAEFDAVAVTVADVTGDDAPNLIAIVDDGDFPLQVFGPTPRNPFGAAEPYAAAPGAFEISTGDLNGNGATDLVVRSPGLLQLYYQGGDGRLQTPLEIPLSNACPEDNPLSEDSTVPWLPVRPVDSVLIADLNGNGRNDLLALNRCSDGGGVEIWTQLADGSLADSQFTPQDRAAFAVAGDITADGNTELVVGVAEFDSSTSHFLAIGSVGSDGTIDFVWPGSALAVVPGVTLGDLTGDGQLEVFMPGHATMLSYLAWTGEDFERRTFEVSQELNAGSIPSMNMIDLDGSGTQDLFLEAAAGYLKAPNLGDGDFGAKLRVPLVPPPVSGGRQLGVTNTTSTQLELFELGETEGRGLLYFNRGLVNDAILTRVGLVLTIAH